MKAENLVTLALSKENKVDENCFLDMASVIFVLPRNAVMHTCHCMHGYLRACHSMHARLHGYLRACVF